MELLEELEQLFSKYAGHPYKKWLKSADVMDILQISPGTLQNLRINGILGYTKLGGIIYYDAEEINRVMTESKIKNIF